MLGGSGSVASEGGSSTSGCLLHRAVKGRGASDEAQDALDRRKQGQSASECMRAGVGGGGGPMHA